LAVFTQETECDVKVTYLSGSYTGGCKNGFAHGKGIAQGTDHYEGEFSKGLPDGNGKYTWSNGIYYEGHWKDGLRDGEGKMAYGDSTVSGIWKDDVYVGKKRLPPYKITYTMSVVRYSITKASKADKNVRIRYYRAGAENVDMMDLRLVYSSGEEYQSGSSMGIQNPTFPLDIKIRFRALNYFHTSAFDVIFEFTINEPGTWDVALNY